jgi:hypothetical protein
MELVGVVERFGGLRPVKRMEGFTMNYEEMERVLRKNTGMLPRTWSEAKRDADYACWIEVPKREWEDALEFGTGMLFMLPFLGMVVYFLLVVLNQV